MKSNLIFYLNLFLLTITCHCTLFFPFLVREIKPVYLTEATPAEKTALEKLQKKIVVSNKEVNLAAKNQALAGEKIEAGNLYIKKIQAEINYYLALKKLHLKANKATNVNSRISAKKSEIEKAKILLDFLKKNKSAAESHQDKKKAELDLFIARLRLAQALIGYKKQLKIKMQKTSLDYINIELFKKNLSHKEVKYQDARKIDTTRQQEGKLLRERLRAIGIGDNHEIL